MLRKRPKINIIPAAATRDEDGEMGEEEAKEAGFKTTAMYLESNRRVLARVVDAKTVKVDF